jgi:hypothetical protein
VIALAFSLAFEWLCLLVAFGFFSENVFGDACRLTRARLGRRNGVQQVPRPSLMGVWPHTKPRNSATSRLNVCIVCAGVRGGGCASGLFQECQESAWLNKAAVQQVQIRLATQTMCLHPVRSSQVLRSIAVAIILWTHSRWGSSRRTAIRAHDVPVDGDGVCRVPRQTTREMATDIKRRGPSDQTVVPGTIVPRCRTVVLQAQFGPLLYGIWITTGQRLLRVN